jgi:hypothetical protein
VERGEATGGSAPQVSVALFGSTKFSGSSEFPVGEKWCFLRVIVAILLEKSAFPWGTA